MNSEMFTLFWYTRAELRLIRRQLNSFTEDNDDSNSNPSDTISLRKEVNDIMREVVQTLDDIIDTENIIVNTLFLSHIIQSFTVHISNLQATTKVATTKDVILFPLDSNIVRINCFIKTLIAIARANLVILCTTTPKPSGPNEDDKSNRKQMQIPPMYMKRTPGMLDRNIKRDEQNEMKVSNGSSTQASSTRTNNYLTRNLPMFEPNKSHTAPLLKVLSVDITTPRDSTEHSSQPGSSTSGSRVKKLDQSKSKSPYSVSHTGMSRKIVDEKIDQITRLTKNLISKDMLTSHAQAIYAMQNSITDKLSPVLTNKKHAKYFNEIENETISTKEKWKSTQNVVRMMARLRVVRTKSG